ncbi:MAG: sigma 54-interacting transcriptional regulator [Hymenobacter sp.]
MVGEAPALRRAQHLARQVAPTDSTVLLEGPTGAGKELFAQALHRGQRAAKASLSWPSIAALFPEICWRASCLATRKGPSPGR